MKKFIEWVRHYALLIIACLVVALMTKTCSSDRKYTFMKNKYEYTITELNRDIDSFNINVRCLRDTIHGLRHENALLKDMLVDAKKDKEYYKKVNTNLINVTNNLSYKRDTIN